MQQVLTITSQKSGQTSIARWKILHLLHIMPNANSTILLYYTLITNLMHWLLFIH